MSQPVEPSITCIGIAVVLQDDNVLVGIRPENTALAGYHEFPGGKCKVDEDSRICAERECLEETGLIVTARELLYDTVHKYDHGTVHLHFWLCELVSSSQNRTPRNIFRWCDVSELCSLNFPEANDEVLRILQAQFTA